MRKIKIIDLLCLISNGEEVPKHIRFDNEHWYWGYDSYVPVGFLAFSPDVQTSESLFQRYRIDYCLNDEVEILDDEEDKDIPLIPDDELWSINGKKGIIEDANTYSEISRDTAINYNFKVLKEKINQIARKINEEDK